MITTFPLGRIVATPGALAALERANQPQRFSWLAMRHGIGANLIERISKRTNTAWRTAFEYPSSGDTSSRWRKALDYHGSRRVG